LLFWIKHAKPTVLFAALTALYFAVLSFVDFASPLLGKKPPVHGVHGVRFDYVQMHYKVLCYVLGMLIAEVNDPAWHGQCWN